MIFKNPWFLLFIPLVFLLIYWVDRKSHVPSIRFPSTKLFSSVPSSLKIRLSRSLGILRLITLTLFIIAFAGPRSVLEETKHKSEGIDIVLALDCSGSMAAEDFTIKNQRFNRLWIVKDVVKDFIKSRDSDRIGLVAFGGLAYTVCPLTTDYSWLLAQLVRIELGLVEDGTAIGSAINTSVSRLKTSHAKSKVVILLTDGLSNAGKIDPLTAAKAAAAYGIKVYTIGAGTDAGFAPFPVKDLWGRTVYQNVQIDLDEKTLKEIARLTKAEYFRATDTESLRKTYAQIDQLEKTEIEETGYKEYKELFPAFLLGALLLLLLESIMSLTLLLRIP